MSLTLTLIIVETQQNAKIWSDSVCSWILISWLSLSLKIANEHPLVQTAACPMGGLGYDDSHEPLVVFCWKIGYMVWGWEEWVRMLNIYKYALKPVVESTLLNLWIFQMLHSSSQLNPGYHRTNMTQLIIFLRTIEDHWMECCLWEPHRAS